jgi:gliding motility-associated-like protein
VGYSNAENPSFTFYEPGVYSVSLEASNELGIVVRKEYEMFITVYETPIAQFRVRPSTVYVPDQPVYTANLSYGATQFFWDFGDEDGIDDTSTEEEPYYYYTNPGVYDIYLWVSNEEGCVDSVLIYKAVIAEPGGELATPNVFTPNPDGPNGGVPGNVAFNDVFLPFEKGAVEFHMQIFNRWGELLFESYDKNIGWDGYYKGQLAKSDVYIYRLDLKLNDGRRLTKLGDVFLLR